MTTEDRRSIPVPSSVIRLTNDYYAAECVQADGGAGLWLVRNVCNDCALTLTHGRADDYAAPHEQLGPLPAAWRRAVAAARIRCLRPRADGQPCRTPVARAGDGCANHRRATPTRKDTNR